MMNRWHVACKTGMDGDWRLEGKERCAIELKDLTEEELIEYLAYLNKYSNCTIDELIEYARIKFPNLLNCKKEDIKSNKTDKGKEGKILEYCLFGNLPNSISGPDLKNLGIEIKATKFKSLYGGFNAKERLTITNCGTTIVPSTKPAFEISEILPSIIALVSKTLL